MKLRLFAPLLTLILAIALVVLAFRQAPPAPRETLEDSFVPRTEAVQWMSLGHRSTAASLFWINGLISYGESFFTGKSYRWITHLADASTRLDTLFKTPYTFVAAITPIAQKDTADFPVLRRGLAKYPGDWQLAVSFALRLSEGPTKEYAEAARLMERFAQDTTVPLYIKTIHKSFALHTQTTEIALAAIIDDCLNPKYKGYRSSLIAKAARALGRNPGIPEQVAPVRQIMNALFSGQGSPEATYHQLLLLRLQNP